MRGHAPLIELRRRGLRPSAVWIDATGMDALQSWRDWHTNQPMQPHIEIAPAESVKRLDLRCLRGVGAVFLDALANDVQRQLDLIEAIQAEGVKRIALTLVDDINSSSVTDLILIDTESKEAALG